MPRGGRRSGTPGKAYPNRTDLSVNKGPVPNVPYGMGGGMGYGESKALSDAQAAVPVASPAAPGASAPPMAPEGPAGPPSLAALLGGPGPAPGELGGFGRPTDRPDTPITHGLPSGPGAGPEVLRTQNTSARTLLQQLAASPYASDDIRDLLNLMG